MSNQENIIHNKKKLQVGKSDEDMDFTDKAYFYKSNHIVSKIKLIEHTLLILQHKSNRSILVKADRKDLFSKAS